MKQKTINIYEFNELKPEIQEEVLNNNREINVSDDWYNSDLEYISEQIEEKTGLKIDYKNLYFEFMSRSNSIWIESKDIFKALSDKYPTLINFDLPNKFGCFCNYLGGGMCSGLNNSDFDDEHIEIEDSYNEEDEILQYSVQEKVNKGIKQKIIKDLGIIQDVLNKGYKGLYESYNYLVSDEAIKETIEANEYEFEENGEMA